MKHVPNVVAIWLFAQAVLGALSLAQVFQIVAIVALL